MLRDQPERQIELRQRAQAEDIHLEQPGIALHIVLVH